MEKTRKKLSLTAKIFISLILGVIAGLLLQKIAESGEEVFRYDMTK